MHVCGLQGDSCSLTSTSSPNNAEATMPKDIVFLSCALLRQYQKYVVDESKPTCDIGDLQAATGVPADGLVAHPDPPASGNVWVEVTKLHLNVILVGIRLAVRRLHDIVANVHLEGEAPKGLPPSAAAPESTREAGGAGARFGSALCR
eukprot:scaffold647902_cov48-Prasinocladus_malaysianus.AAC.3